MAFTNMDADAFMTARMGDNDDEYASAVESKIAEHEAWSLDVIAVMFSMAKPQPGNLSFAFLVGLM